VIQSFLKNLILFLIRVYQKTLSLDHGIFHFFFPNGYCRFYPTCSEYGYQAIVKYGVWHGSYLALRRILHCHPWHPGGYDPLK
jgi:putative membrane protein insertion efficiency factor